MIFWISARPCFSAPWLPDGAEGAVQTAFPPASSRRVKSTRSPPGDHCGAPYSRWGPNMIGLLPSRLISIRTDAVLLPAAGLAAKRSEAASGAQFRSDQDWLPELLAIWEVLPPVSRYSSVPVSRWIVKARSALADQLKPVAPSSRRCVGPGVRSSTTEPLVDCTARNCPFGDAARLPSWSTLSAGASRGACSPTMRSVPLST